MDSEGGQTNEAFEKEDFVDADNEMDKTHDIFCQMDVLRSYNDDVIWKEIRRWVKFEEVLEEKGKRWSKPHVSSLTMQSLSELQMLLATSPFIFDVDANSMYDIVDTLLERWRKEGQLENILWNHVRSVLLKRHKHHHINSKQVKRHESRRQEVKQTLTLRHNGTMSCPDFLEANFHQSQQQTATENDSNQTLSTSSNGDESKEFVENFSFGAEENRKFKRKIPAGAEVLNIMVGEVKELTYRLGALVRLNKAKDVGTITEVSLPTRFLFILLVPKKQLDDSLEVGRCMGTLMTDQIFRDAAYKCTNKVDLIHAVQDFASHVTVLPPGCWDPKIRLEPPPTLPVQETTRNNKEVIIEMDEEEEHDSHYDPTLERTGRVFGGLVNDVKRKLKWFKSDFTDCLHMQCLASFIYLFLATLTPNVTFGGLLGQATDNYMGTMECILAASITGVVFALFSGQPLNILGSTGPMLVLEMILYNFSKEFGWDFMPLRVWVGLWTTFLLLLIVAFDLSSLVRYITRFTEECFACLIAFIFIYQAVAKLLEIGHKAPVHLHPPVGDPSNCFCIVNNDTLLRSFINSDGPINNSEIAVLNPTENVTSIDFSGETHNLKELGVHNCTEFGGILIGTGCDINKYVPDVFFFSILLFLGTFIIAVGLVKARNGSFFPNIIRQTLSDFSVLTAIVCMVGLDAALGLPTPKLTVPTEFKPTRSDRGWFINPVGDHNPWWLIPASIIPAILATILVFMDQQITSVIVNRKEHKLQKGGGYHLDLLVVAILISVCSLLGLPWYVAATVTAIAHVMSLKKESECTAPGEKPTFLGVREQRVTALLVGIFSGLAVFITSVLKYIPMPVLYGVFFYMGISALNGMQLFERILIIFMPQKHQPDHPYLRHVPLTRVYLFTGIQILCLVFLWVIKSIKEIAILFPVMVLAICFVRKALDFFFCQYDLKWLDEILPGAKKNPPKKEVEQISFTVEGYNRKKFMRSISVPAQVQPSPPKRSSLGSWLSNPVLSRTLSTESIKVAISSKISGYVPQRKVSILSLPSHPTFLLSSDDSDSNSEKDREFDMEDSCT